MSESPLPAPALARAYLDVCAHMPREEDWLPRREWHEALEPFLGNGSPSILAARLVVAYDERQSAGREAARLLVARYLANRGSGHEFVVCVTPPTGGDVHKQWRALADAIEVI